MKDFEINNRIVQLIDSLRVSNNHFAKEIGISSSRISNIVTFRNKPDSELLGLIVKKYRNLNSEWLLVGAGEVWKSENNEELSTGSGYSQDKKSDLVYIIERKDQKILELSEEVWRLRREIETLKKNTTPRPYDAAAES